MEKKGHELALMRKGIDTKGLELTRTDTKWIGGEMWGDGIDMKKIDQKWNGKDRKGQEMDLMCEEILGNG